MAHQVPDPTEHGIVPQFAIFIQVSNWGSWRLQYIIMDMRLWVCLIIFRLSNQLQYVLVNGLQRAYTFGLQRAKLSETPTISSQYRMEYTAAALQLSPAVQVLQKKDTRILAAALQLSPTLYATQGCSVLRASASGVPGFEISL
jgi:hypothetical protein